MTNLSQDEKLEKKREQSRRAQKKWQQKNPDYQKNWVKENKEHSLEYRRQWSRRKWREDPEFREKKKEYEKERRRKRQLEAIEHYGGQCYCCGESNPTFLCLDHIDGGGNQHRKETGARMGEWAKRNGWPDIFQVACHNCNFGRHLNGGICPHQESGT